MFFKFLFTAFFLLFQYKCFSYEIERYTGLKEIVEEALLADPYIKAAEHELRMGEARREEARGHLLPQVSAYLSSQKVDRVDNGFKSKIDGDRKSIEINQIIYDASAFHNYEKNKKYSLKSNFDYEDARDERVFNISEKYFDVMEKTDNVELLKKEIESHQVSLSKFNKLYQKKMTPIADLLLLSANNDLLKISLIDAENELDKSRQDIFEILGREFFDVLKNISEENIDDINIENTLVEVIDFSMRNNKKFLAKSQELEAAKSAWDESLSGHKPKLNLNFSMQKNSIGYDYTASQKNDVYAANLQLSIPIFSGGSSHQENKFHRENFLKIEDEIDLMRRSIIKNLTDSYKGFSAEKNRIKAVRSALKSSQQSILAAEKSFSYGVIDIVELQERINQQYKLKRELNLSKYNLIKKYLKLHKWMGKIGDEEINYLNNFFVIRNMDAQM